MILRIDTGDERVVNKVLIEKKGETIRVFVDGEEILSFIGEMTIYSSSEKLTVNGVKYDQVTIVFHKTGFSCAYEHNFGQKYVITKFPTIVIESR